MKKLHLVCNAHLDPAWLWRWNEGLAEAISTFRVAADFCDKYDGFVFNHNESLLYEWVEEHEPALFERIKKLVAQGKWHIMGGWYLQPDCVMTSGESLLSQIDLGREYFKEKFGVEPKTAVNVDSFGHTRGLVQILKAKGYEGYTFMRPQKIYGDFLWEGFDGSTVIGQRLYGAYATAQGDGLRRVEECATTCIKDVEMCFWGIGNHGGGPSKIDLEAINEYIKKSDVEIVHSTPENYLKEAKKTELPVINTSLGKVMVGCYTSMVRIKQANRRVENKIATLEKIMSYANLCSDFEYAGDELAEVKKRLAFCQFHDILPGSSIKAVEEDALRTLAFAEDKIDRLFQKAFFKLCEGQKKAKEGTIPVLVFNPHPYEIEGDFDVDFIMQLQNWNDNEETIAIVYDQNGNICPSQNEKARSTFSLDWAKKVSFRAKLAPASISRFDCELKTINTKELDAKKYDNNTLSFENERMEVVINRKTGLIDKLVIDGKALIEKGGQLEVYNDNEDPWAMRVSAFDDFDASFELMSDLEVSEFLGYPDEVEQNVRVVEDGEVRTKIQTFWKYKNSKAVIEYTVPKHDIYIDVNITLHSNDVNKTIKYNLNTAFDGVPYGQTAFGSEELEGEQKECVFHKWCALKNDDTALAVYNKGTYAGSFTENKVKITLLRTPVYACHPIADRPFAPHNRFLEHIDIGERHFVYRISNGVNLEQNAQIYNEEPVSMSFFPSGDGTEKQSALSVDSSNIIVSSLRKKNDKFIMTMYNTTDTECTAKIKLYDKQEITEKFGSHQLKIIEI